MKSAKVYFCDLVLQRTSLADWRLIYILISTFLVNHISPVNTIYSPLADARPLLLQMLFQRDWIKYVMAHI